MVPIITSVEEAGHKDAENEIGPNHTSNKDNNINQIEDLHIGNKRGARETAQ